MRTLQGSETLRCLLGCENGHGRIEYYATCRIAWDYLGTAAPRGFGLDRRLCSLTAFLSLERVERELSDAERARMAIAVYAVARTVQTLRQTPDAEPRPLLRLHAAAVK